MAYHNKPPYIVDFPSKQGAYFDFVRFLNQKSNRYQFHLKFTPVKRVRQIVNNESFDGMVLGVNPVWFDDVARDKYLWTSAVFKDEDVFVSLKQAPFEFHGSDSLVGKDICLVLGNYYSGVTDQANSLNLTILPASRESAIFELLSNKRCEIGIVSGSNYRYRLESQDISDIYHVSVVAHDKFDRLVLIARTQLPIYLFIEQALREWEVLN